jgi:hypothetical protein
MKQVALYCVPTSVEYPMTREYLNQKKITFNTFLLDTENQIKAETGQLGKLQLVVYDVGPNGDLTNPQVIVGFDKERLEDLLNIAHEQPVMQPA